MYNKNDKRRLYWLIDQYLFNKIDETTFCDEFHDSLVNEIYFEGLTDIEIEIFSQLSDVSQRFSKYEEDFKLWKGFVTANELRQKIVETKKILDDRS